jgi:hypothetical protein
MRRFVTVTLLVLIVLGCFGRRSQREPERARHWELAWVDPQILISDSVMTVITAARIDSFVVEPTEVAGREAASIVFEVTRPDCDVVVNLYNENGRLLRPLMARYLNPGYYKLTLHAGFMDRHEYPAAAYVLRADCCGESGENTFYSR